MSIIVRTMLSTGSLAAFTASAPQAQALRNGPGIPPLSQVRRVNTQQPGGAGGGPASPAPVPQPGGAAPARTLPRGSLVDLSV